MRSVEAPSHGRRCVEQFEDVGSNSARNHPSNYGLSFHLFKDILKNHRLQKKKAHEQYQQEWNWRSSGARGENLSQKLAPPRNVLTPDGRSRIAIGRKKLPETIVIPRAARINGLAQCSARLPPPPPALSKQPHPLGSVRSRCVGVQGRRLYEGQPMPRHKVYEHHDEDFAPFRRSVPEIC